MKKSNNIIIDYKKQWYPVAIIDYLDKKKPHHFELFGNNLVIWYCNDKNKFIVFIDACPHKGCPLSEGRIENNILMSSYDGWKYNSNGECVDIPHAKLEDNKTLCTLANIYIYPSEEKQGLLWVYTDTDIINKNFDIKTSSFNIPEIDNLEYKEKIIANNQYFRDIPCSFDIFIENMLDPIHSPITHHGDAGDRHKSPNFLDISIIDDINLKGFKFEANDKTGQCLGLGIPKKLIYTFNSPSNTNFIQTYNNNAKIIVRSYATPINNGYTRIFTQAVVLKGDDNKLPDELKIFNYFPKWLYHLGINRHFSMVIGLLHKREINLKIFNYKSLYLPTPSDIPSKLLYKWYSIYSNIIPYKNERKLTCLNNDELYDIYNSHTRNCTLCLSTLNRLKYIRIFLISLLLYNYNNYIFTIIIFFLLLQLNKFIKIFYKIKFKHYLNN
mgnify:CR=1 FL=1